jgi:hypothetical protein
MSSDKAKAVKKRETGKAIAQSESSNTFTAKL